MLNASETTCRLIAATFLLPANKVLQSYARNLRATSRSIVLKMTEKKRYPFKLKNSNPLPKKHDQNEQEKKKYKIHQHVWRGIFLVLIIKIFKPFHGKPPFVTYKIKHFSLKLR